MSNVDKLPDSYAKGTSSNNYKLLNLNEQSIADAKTDAQAVFDMVDLQQATGHTLDLYGEMVGQKRGTLNDVQYRYMILTRIGMNVVQGNYKTVIESIKSMFGCGAKDIILKDSENPCCVEVVKFPLEVLVNAGFSGAQAVSMINSLLPVGVSLEHVNFDGTFEFADTADIYDETSGFGDIEQTIGGYLGMLQVDGDDTPIIPL